jgi:hypothetical protein
MEEQAGIIQGLAAAEAAVLEATQVMAETAEPEPTGLAALAVAVAVADKRRLVFLSAEVWA